MIINSIEGTRAKFDGGGMFGHAPKPLWSKWYEADEINRITVACRGLLIRSSNMTILCDVPGAGYMDSRTAERFGIPETNIPITDELTRLGVSEQDVDFIFVSHLHFDHAGGLIPNWPASEQSDWKPLFPNARYVVSRTQFDRATTPHPKDRASYVPTLPDMLKKSGRLILVDKDSPDNADLPDFISLSFSEGHTPGLMHPCISTGDDTIFFCSDLVPGTSWLHLPIVSGYDRNPEQLVNEKETILKRAAAENWLLVYPHDNKIAASHVDTDEKGRFTASAPQEVLSMDTCKCPA